MCHLKFTPAIALNILMLVCCLPFSQAQHQCISMDYQLPSGGEALSITSPNYPNAYRPGTNCRHRITAPRDHVVILTCSFRVIPNTCNTEYFFISLDGDLQFRDGQRFCTSTQFTRVSNFRSAALSYASSSSNTGLRGRFRCTARARRAPCSCGWSTGTRITNGQETRPNEFPSMVALRDITSPQAVYCGGSIISHRHILTAAHCTRFYPDPSIIMAFVGYHNLLAENATPFAARYRIQRIINHPGYLSTATTTVNDIAILVTRIPIEWSRGVGPVCLPWRAQMETFAYHNADVAGWGTLSFAGPKSPTLQKAQLMIVENGVCRQQYNDTIISTQICTYDYRGLGQDSCQYDSGGPVFLRQQGLMLLGIISYGRSCGQRYGVSVNTRITSYLGWIWRYTQNDVCVL